MNHKTLIIILTYFFDNLPSMTLEECTEKNKNLTFNFSDLDQIDCMVTHEYMLKGHLDSTHLRDIEVQSRCIFCVTLYIHTYV